jgi:hypothetical protein
LGRANLFGPPPILPGEDPKAYDEMLNRIVSAIAPRDFVEQIWVHDLTNAAWDLFRWRRMETAYLAAAASEEADKKVSRLAVAQMTALRGPEQGEIARFLKSELAWEKRAASYPRANQKFQELAAAARSTLSIDHIQARVMKDCMYWIERIEARIMTAQRRFDEIMRELHRHRFMQNQTRRWTVLSTSYFQRDGGPGHQLLI